MRISAINTNAKTVFASKKKDKKEERLAKKEAQHPYTRYQQKKAKLNPDNLGMYRANIKTNNDKPLYPITIKDRKGRVMCTQDKLSDGTIIVKYFEKGELTSASKFYPNGKRAVLYVDENQKPISWEEIKPDGTRQENIYDEDGKLFIIKTKTSNETHLRKYNQEGILTEETFLTNDGKYTNVRYNRGKYGNETIIETLSPDGSESKSYTTRLIYNNLAQIT